jgi:long-chain acyl-CoA synthetase
LRKKNREKRKTKNNEKKIVRYGNSFKNSLVAVVVPKWDYIKGWASQNGMKGTSNSEFVETVALQKAIVEDFANVGKESGLKPYELVKALKISTEPFGTENDLATPTFKLKRLQLLQHFKKEIEELYVKLGEGTLKQ